MNITKINYNNDYDLDNPINWINTGRLKLKNKPTDIIIKEKPIYERICMGCGVLTKVDNKFKLNTKIFTCGNKCKENVRMQREIVNIDKNKNTCYKCKKTFKKTLLRVSKRTTTFVCTKCNTLRVKKYRQTKSGKLAVKKAIQKSNQRFKEKAIARQMVFNAIKSGKLIKPKKCSNCGLFKKLDGHHDDYNKPLDVIWLCRYCHVQHHRKPVDNVLAMVEGVL